MTFQIQDQDLHVVEEVPEVLESVKIAFGVFIGRAIAALRRRRGMSQRALARALSFKLLTLIHPSYISKLESGGIQNLCSERLAAIATVLQCSVSLIVEIAEFMADLKLQEVDEEAMLTLIKAESMRRLEVSNRRK